MSGSWSLPPGLERARRRALLVGAAGIAASLLALLFGTRQQFFLSYLFAYLFWIGLPLGSFALLMLQHLTGGAWGLALRRPLETGTRMIPLMAILFIPLLFGLGDLYVWVGDPHARGGGTVPLRETWLGVGFFLTRAVLYFASWIGFGFLLNRWSREQDRTGDPRIQVRLRILSGAGLPLYGLTATFAAVDWVMSLTPEWYSTVYGMIFMAGQGLSSLALMVGLTAILAPHEPLAAIANRDLFQDLGNLLFAFVMLWAYLAYSQFLIIWSADLAEEVPFYLYRTAGGWKWIVGLLMVFHFFVPFLLLLSRSAKRNRKTMAGLAAAILAMRLVDLHWMVVPAHAQGRHLTPIPGFHLHFLDFALPVAMGGIWVWVFLGQLGRLPILPPRDPRLLETARHA
jgi:hypothetical protein